MIRSTPNYFDVVYRLFWGWLSCPDLSQSGPTCADLSWSVLFWRELRVCLSVFMLNLSLLSRLCSLKQSFRFFILSIVKKEMFPSHHIQSLNLSPVTQRCCDTLPIKRPTANIAKLSPSQTHNHLISCQIIKRPYQYIFSCCMVD